MGAAGLLITVCGFGYARDNNYTRLAGGIIQSWATFSSAEPLTQELRTEALTLLYGLAEAIVPNRSFDKARLIISSY